MKRAILSLPEGTRYEDLPDEQKAAVDSVFAQFVLPMPGTIAANGRILVDGIAADNFDPDVMPGLGMDWQVVGLWQWDGKGELVTIEPLDEAVMLAHLPPIREYDEEGDIISEVPRTVAEIPHSWAGWPTTEEQ